MIEQTILCALLHDEEYTRKVIPFIKTEYFEDLTDRYIFDVIKDYIDEYNSLPTKQALKISFDTNDRISEDQFKLICEKIDGFVFEPNTDIDWLTDNTEKFCQDRAVYNAVRESITILDGNSKQKDKGAIPQVLSEALGV